MKKEAAFNKSTDVDLVWRCVTCRNYFVDIDKPALWREARQDHGEISGFVCRQCKGSVHVH